MKKWVSLPQKRQLGPHKDKHTHTHMRTHTHTNTALVNSYKGLIFRLYWSGHNLLSNATPLLRPRSDFIMCLVSTALFHYILLNGFCHPTHSHWFTPDSTSAAFIFEHYLMWCWEVSSVYVPVGDACVGNGLKTFWCSVTIAHYGQRLENDTTCWKTIENTFLERKLCGIFCRCWKTLDSCEK